MREPIILGWAKVLNKYNLLELPIYSHLKKYLIVTYNNHEMLDDIMKDVIIKI